MTRLVFIPVKSATWYSFYNPCKHTQVSVLISFVVVVTLVVRLFTILQSHSELLSHWERILLVYSLFQVLISGQFLSCEIWKFWTFETQIWRIPWKVGLIMKLLKGLFCCCYKHTFRKSDIYSVFSPYFLLMIVELLVLLSFNMMSILTSNMYV